MMNPSSVLILEVRRYKIMQDFQQFLGSRPHLTMTLFKRMALL